MARKDAVWAHVTQMGSTQRCKCNYCGKMLSSNRTYLKKHITGKACKAPTDVKKLLQSKLDEGRRADAKSGASNLRRDKRSHEDLYGADDGGPPRESIKASKTSIGGVDGGGCGSSGAGGASGSVADEDRTSFPYSSFFSSMSSAQQERATELCARWPFREGLPLRMVESDNVA